MQLTRKVVRGTSRPHADFAQELASLIYQHSKTLPLDELVCIGAAVIADYARGQISPRYLDVLANIIIAREGFPLPNTGGEH